MPWTTALNSSLHKNKIQKSLKLIEKPFISQKVYKKYQAQKSPKICCGCRVSEAKIYLHHSSKIDKARPHRVEISKKI